ncbi:peptide MFS transporter [Glacieibacterium frigidum]|uniref:peptide MFS transporter n=1 Tax=Glacieibacterium frigidum TaxID=2593303 RepID=UPI00163DCB1C|nr:MFS transporter [Glacieibacterium frigidum]
MTVETTAQPRALRTIVATEAFDRFSFYGMITLLPLYLNAELLRPGTIETVLGLGGLQRLLFGSGTPSIIALGSAIYGLYAGTVSIMPLLGGVIGDRLIGARRAVLSGCLIMAAGHALMTQPAYFLVALVLLVTGSGMVRANMAAQVASLYGPDDPRRKGGFGIYLIGLNVGAMAAPLIAGTLGEKIGFDWGFGAAAIAMLVAIGVYVVGWRHLPVDALRRSGGAMRAKLSRRDGQVIGALVLMLLPLILMTAAYNQAFNILLVWAEAKVDRSVFGLTMPVTWFVSIDGALTIIAVAVLTRIWARQARAGRDWSDWRWIALGGTIQVAALLALAWGTWVAGAGQVSIWPVLLFFLLSDIATPMSYTVIQSTFARAAPLAIVAVMMAVFALYDAASQFAVGALGGLYDRLTTVDFWLVHAGVAGLSLVAVAVLRPLIGPLLSPAASAPDVPR